MDNLEIITTRDGSSTIYNRSLDETYHSRHGAITESQYVFIEKGIQFYIHKGNGPFRIFEVGFGTGLNATLTMDWAEKNSVEVIYYSIEAFPLDIEVVKSLNYFQENISLKNKFDVIHESNWEKEFRLSEYFTLKKINGDLLKYKLQKDFHNLIYYDAFAPSKQSEIWELPVIAKVIDSLNIEGVFVTYCAKGQLKRDLRSLGCEVESLPGPPGKFEMVRATKTHIP